MKFIDRTGEINYNKHGSKMIICKYITSENIDVYFPQYDWTVKHIQYGRFKRGYVKCPYEKSVYGVGYIGEGKYIISKNGKETDVYKIWRGVLRRCYDEKVHKKHPTYKDCIVCEEWHNFQNFAKWYEENYYQVNNEKMHLDKDILIKGNKIYSPQTCIFVPNKINTLFTKGDAVRGDLPIGVALDKRHNKYQSQCRTQNGSRKWLGYYNTSYEAFQVYKRFKESLVKQVADEYKPYIPQKLYEAMYNYKVEIID